jgi:glycerol-3-phosphate acyltransferase PlsY
MLITLLVAVALTGYFLGSIPFGLFIGRIFAGKDIRQVGSGKIGMTNVMRTAGKKAAALSLLLDMGKCALAALTAKWIFSTGFAVNLNSFPWRETAMVLGALAAISGHTWSIFLKFKGGRGVATFIGGLIAMYWPVAAIGGGLMLLIGFRTRYMSLGSIIGAVAAFIALMSFTFLGVGFLMPTPPVEYVIYAMIGAIFIYIMHRDNIIRLFNGTERKIGEKAKAEPAPSTNAK